MSNLGHSDQRPPSEAGKPTRWDPDVTLLMIVLGFPLLLPGACSFMFSYGGGIGSNPIAVLGFLIGFGGLAMICFGIRRLVSPRSAATAPPAIGETAKRIMLLIVLAIVVAVALVVTKILRLW